MIDLRCTCCGSGWVELKQLAHGDIIGWCAKCEAYLPRYNKRYNISDYQRRENLKQPNHPIWGKRVPLWTMS